MDNKKTVVADVSVSAAANVNASTIDPRAIIHPKAKVDVGVAVGPFAIIGAEVEIAAGTTVGSHAVIEGRTKIGRNNKIFQFAAIGAAPQDKKYQGEDTSVEIGDENMIREFCTIHRGTAQGKGVTKIGDRNLLMNYVHVAHDCVVGSDVVFANNATLAGHVKVGNFVTLGGFSKVAQFCMIGDYSFIAGATDVAKDVPPYIVVAGHYDNVKIYGLNVIGLKRRGFSDETIKGLEKAYDVIYRTNLTVQQVIPELEQMVVTDGCPEVQRFIDMLQNSKKGIVR